MTSQTEQQIITIHIFPNISGSKGKHRMKFDQLIKYNLRNIVLEKLYTKNVGETSPKAFFCYMSKSKSTKVLNQMADHLLSLYIKFFFFKKKDKFWN